MASATAAFLPSEKANLEPLPWWGVGRGRLGHSAEQLLLCRKVQTPRSGSRNEVWSSRSEILYWLHGTLLICTPCLVVNTFSTSVNASGRWVRPWHAYHICRPKPTEEACHSSHWSQSGTALKGPPTKPDIPVWPSLPSEPPVDMCCLSALCPMPTWLQGSAPPRVPR